jgi:hypothetical protein
VLEHALHGFFPGQLFLKPIDEIQVKCMDVVRIIFPLKVARDGTSLLVDLAISGVYQGVGEP